MDNNLNYDLLICISLQLLVCCIIPLAIPVVILCPYETFLDYFLSIFVLSIEAIVFVCLSIFIWKQYKAWRRKK